MPRESRSYRHRSRSRSRSPHRRGGRSPERIKDRDRLKRKAPRSRETIRLKSLKSQNRNRSRSKERSHKRRSRSQSKDRNRDKRSRSTSKEKKLSKLSPVKDATVPVKEEPTILNKDDEQKRLEEEMLKRRERIEKWREDRKPKEELPPIQIVPPSKEWSLEDDTDDEEDVGANQTGENGQEKDVDPLDAYMQSVNDEVKQINDKDQKSTGTNTKSTPKNTDLVSATAKNKVTIITAVAKKPNLVPVVRKGELMESNMDAMEYSSEEETEDLDDAMTKLAKKKKVPTATLR